MKKLISVLLCMIMLFSVVAVGSTSAFAAQKQTVASSAVPMAHNPGNTEDERTGFSKFIRNIANLLAEIFTQSIAVLLNMMGFDIGDFLN
ncbi:MAG: hypothetical protein K5756_10180 [Clostridiales bacterium]|nr:hypothetical protein [Clostridiales bacterium]